VLFAVQFKDFFYNKKNLNDLSNGTFLCIFWKDFRGFLYVIETLNGDKEIWGSKEIVRDMVLNNKSIENKRFMSHGKVVYERTNGWIVSILEIGAVWTWLQILVSNQCEKIIKSGWSSGRKLKFYPTNPGLTPAKVKLQKNLSKTT